MGLESAVSPVVNFIKSLSSPVQILGLLVIVFIIRKIVQSKFRKPPPPPREKPLEAMKKRDFTPQELLEYDGVKQKRVLLAVNFKVFDVTRGKDFYGPGKFFMYVVREIYALFGLRKLLDVGFMFVQVPATDCFTVFGLQLFLLLGALFHENWLTWLIKLTAKWVRISWDRGNRSVKFYERVNACKGNQV